VPTGRRAHRLGQPPAPALPGRPEAPRGRGRALPPGLGKACNEEGQNGPGAPWVFLRLEVESLRGEGRGPGGPDSRAASEGGEGGQDGPWCLLAPGDGIPEGKWG